MFARSRAALEVRRGRIGPRNGSGVFFSWVGKLYNLKMKMRSLEAAILREVFKNTAV